MTGNHILIVDDEPRVAFFLSKSLEHTKQNYNVSIAHSGEEALEILNRSSIDLLVTDLRMPGIDGLELMRWVRASSPHTRTILITAYGNDKVEAEARRLEIYRYITKPFNMDDFTKAVQEALRDVAVSQPGLVVLSDKSFEVIAQHLEDLSRDVGAQCIFLADMLGQRLVEVGVTKGFDSTTVLSLLAGGFATTSELARYLGSEKAINLNFYEGARYEIYSANVGNNLFLAMLYDRKGKASRVGLVWLYTRRAIKRLLAILSTADAVAPAQPLDAEFSASLMTELDSLFPGTPTQEQEKRDPVPTPYLADQTGAGQPPPLAGLDEQPLSTPALGEAEQATIPVPIEVKGPVLRADVPPVAGGPALSPPSEKMDSEEELIDLETAIARGILPPHLSSGQEQDHTQEK